MDKKLTFRIVCRGNPEWFFNSENRRMSINWISRNCHIAVSTFAGNNDEDNWINKTWQSKHINNPPLNWIVGEQKNNERKIIIMITY